MAFDFKTATPVTSGITTDFLIFGANSQAVANPSIYTVNALVNFFANTVVDIGNSVANVYANSTLIKVANATSTANLNPVSLTIGTSVVNSTVHAAGANVVVSTTDLKIGNSTVNALANSILLKIHDATSSANHSASGFTVGTQVVNTTVFASGANVIVSTIDIKIGNSTVNTFANSLVVSVADATGTANVKPGSVQVQANVLLNSTKLSIGNTTANLTANSILVQVTDAAGTANVQPNQIVVGNSTVYTTIGSATRSVTGSNTFNLGTAAATANGYTFLFNGILMQWGWVDANATVGDVTFQVAFPTAIFSYQATSNNTTAANAGVAIIGANTTVMQVRSTSTAAASNTFWFAIGN